MPLAIALSVTAGDTLRPSFVLRPIVTHLDTMVVSEKSFATRMNEFEYRRELGFGHFITAEEIDKRNEVFVADGFAPYRPWASLRKGHVRLP